MNKKQCNAQSQLEDHGIILDCKYSFNPVRTFAPQRKELKNFIMDLDSVQACNRFEWVGVPSYLPKFMIEQMLYTRSKLAFFKRGKEFKLLPYVADATLNDYGLSTKMRPIAYNGDSMQKKEPSYEEIDNTEEKEIEYFGDSENSDNKCVLLFDRFGGFRTSTGPAILPKVILQNTICNEIVNRLSMLNINLVNSQGKNVILVRDPKQQATVEKALDDLYASDKAYGMVKSMFEVQVINNTVENDQQNLWEDIMSWNNLRLEGLGITNNGLFNKKEREITGEINSNGEQTQITGDAYYKARKYFVETVKKTFGNDPDFKRDFAGFDVIDLRQPQTTEKGDKNDDMEDEDNDSDNFNF